MAKIILLTGSIVGYAYAMEFFVAWYSGNQYQKFAFYNRIFGPNLVVPVGRHALSATRFRRSFSGSSAVGKTFTLSILSACA